MRTRRDPRERLAPLRRRREDSPPSGAPDPAERPEPGVGGWVPRVGGTAFPADPETDVDPETDADLETDGVARWGPPVGRSSGGGRHRAAGLEPDVEDRPVPVPVGDGWIDDGSDGEWSDGSDEEWPDEQGSVAVWSEAGWPENAGTDGESTDGESTSGESTDGDTADRETADRETAHREAAAGNEGAEPVTPRAHRINGRWGRFAELWVPESMRHARVDPGRRGMIVLVLVAAVAAVAAAIGVWRDRPEPRPIETTMVAAVTDRSAPAAASAAPPAPSGSTSVPSPAEILVSVTGLVTNPGVVRLPPDARVADAIAAAGGVQAGANLTGTNLAAKLADGDSVVVTDAPTPAGSAAGPVAAGPTVAAGAGGPSSAPVDLNTADAAALDTLPGVGPVMAQNIIAWRDANGRFTSVEQLQEISGIGPSRYAQLAGLVTVG